ncbi:MAG: hypothetical protein ACI8TQ_003248 [Planctomycetota bacterium]|jgi:hypothetical protein
MNRTQQTLLLICSLLVAVAAGTYLYFGTDLERGAAVEAVDLPSYGTDSLERGDVVLTVPRINRSVDQPTEPTTVIWPLEVELDLIQPSYLPETEEGLRPGTGRRSRIVGNIADMQGQPVLAEIEFVAGANKGRTLVCGSDGSFGANDLYPGLAIVKVSGKNIVGSRRELVLRQNTEYTLNIGYGRPGAIQGEVFDSNGEGIFGAKVLVDGQATSTDETGYFYLAGIASDRALLEIEAEGYSGVREVVGITADFTIPRGRLVYRLERGADLVVSLKTAIGDPGKAQIVILPADTKQQRRYPWYRLNPIEITPGASITLRDLPVGPVAVRIFHRGAVAVPRERIVNLRTKMENRVEIELQPGPVIRGTITRNGKPVPGARVKLEAPDRVGATLSYFRTAHWFLESEVLPTFPFAVQEARADKNGNYIFTSWADVSATRYLEAWSLDGEAWGGRMVGAEEAQADLELSDWNRGDSELVIDLPGRTQALDIQLIINGTPAEGFSLRADRKLIIDSLLAGTWKVKANWYDNVILDEEEVELSGSASLTAQLPEEAIVGAGREAWIRAGKTYPKSP